MKGFLLIAHGSRNRLADKEFMELAAIFAAQMAAPVAPCYLEMCQPDISAGFDELYAQGVREVVAVPCFLFSGRHMERDIPNFLAGLAAKYDDVIIYTSSSLGPDYRLAEILRDRALNAQHKIEPR